jgi:glycine/D-amino acid oxidase-like deaminating enzyme
MPRPSCAGGLKGRVFRHDPATPLWNLSVRRHFTAAIAVLRASGRRLLQVCRRHPILLTAPLAVVAVGAGFAAQDLLPGGRSRSEADLLEGVEAYKIEDLGGTQVVKTDSGDFETSMIVLALNGYSTSLHPYFADKIYPTRGQCLMMEPVKRFMEGPCYANFYLDYFRQTPTGELLIGGFRQIEKATEVGYSDHTSDLIQNSLHSFVQTYLPELQTAKVTHRWGGVMGFSKDGEPMVGSIPENPAIFFAGGYTGHGIGLAFNTAKTLVDLIFGKAIPEWISARRFS